MTPGLDPGAGWNPAPPGAVWLCPECEREVRPVYRGEYSSGIRVRCPECGRSEYRPPTAGEPWEVEP